MNFFVNKQEYDSRLDHCGQCSNYTTIKTCDVCNCFMPLKAKFSTNKCPIQKWDISDSTYQKDPIGDI